MQGRILTALAILALTTSPALADDWIVTRLRGGVFVLTYGQWEQLVRGSVVSDDRVIKSAPNGRATFVRNLETVELGPDTTAQIADVGGFTTVYNHAGTVGVDAEARNVQHFAVQTPFLAAVVKGTAFVVQSNEVQSRVAVTRGNVEVNDERHESTISLGAGEEVSSSEQPITSADIVPVSPGTPRPPNPEVALPPTRVGGSAPGHVAAGFSYVNASGDHDGGSPGNSGNAPGHGGSSPGNSDSAPGHGGGSPGNSGDPPGNSGDPPGHGGGSPGNSGNAPGHGGGSPGNSGNAPGHGGSSPGNTGNAPGQSGDRDGGSGNGGDDGKSGGNGKGKGN
ncbi:FecR domain-containing protein [Devosia sp. RR2S18]|uniref:FecR domain-containing protein n=1 Tax=Devosia rhizosphaerae TaxID=3049774 RepID=UPI0025410150|nr:FecR domain-containing protein [Devosia sp. RR2S18]WIJ23929.1 FecR domain-containing protein [Devosia sp. RR2S18]